MSVFTSRKPGTVLALPVDDWTTVAVARIPAGTQAHSMLYANVSGLATTGATVVQLDVRALRDAGTDETALGTYTAAVNEDGTYRCRITAPWFGARPGNSLHWQIMPGRGVLSATVKGSRYAKAMT